MEGILVDSADDIDHDDGSDQGDTDCEMSVGEEERSPNETQNNPMSEDSSGSEFHGDADLESESDSTTHVDSGMLMSICSVNIIY
jgi:hypothetical protein